MLGWNVLPTSRNARGVDILIYSFDVTRKYTVQVKALSKRSAVPLGNSVERLVGDFFIICRNVCSDAPDFFVLTPAEVKHRASKTEKNGKVAYWLEPRQYETDEFKGKWERIGNGMNVPLKCPAVA
jgi:hypothetical protein